jgi:hypothetical protein
MLRASGTNGTGPDGPSGPSAVRPQDVLTPPTPVADGAGAHGAAGAAAAPVKGKHHEGLSTQQASWQHNSCHIRLRGSRLMGPRSLSQSKRPRQ